MARTTPVRRLVLGACMATALLAAGCTPDATESTPSPTPATPTTGPAPAATTSAGASPEELAARAADLLVAAFDDIYNDRDAARNTIREVTQPGSEARDWLRGQLRQAEATNTTGGDLVAELVEVTATTEGINARYCASSSTRADPPTDDVEPWSDLVAMTAGKPPRLESAGPPESDDGTAPALCVPPSISESFLTRDHPQWRDAKVAYFADPQDRTAQAQVAGWLLAGDEGLAGLRDRAFLADTWVDPVIEFAERDTLVMSQCQDPTRNPDARVETADGQVVELQPTAQRYQFQLRDGRWLQGDFTNHGPDSADPGPWLRCFGDAE